jgi:hypothetical protein
LVWLVLVDSVLELLGVVPTSTSYWVAVLTADHSRVIRDPFCAATRKFDGAAGAVQDDCGGGLLEPGDDDGPVGEDPSFSLPPHAIVTTAAMAMKNNPARFMLHSFAGSLDDLLYEAPRSGG